MTDSASAPITTVSSRPVRMGLREPYTIAYETVDSTTNVFIRIETDGGPTGVGCAAPDEAVTGETADSVLRAVRDVAAPLVRGRDALDAEPLLADLASALAGQPAALAGLDMALHDIQGKARGVPIRRLMGGARDRIATSITIGILPADETVNRARAFVKQGFRRLKMKGGLDARADADRVLRVRQAVGVALGLSFDANQGFSVAQTVRFAEATAGARLEFIEQPTPRDRPDLLGRAARETAVPIMADEGLMTVADMQLIADGRLADLVNIKLMKVGGLAQAARIDDVAAAAGIGAMVGCMDESALGIAAGLHFALARPNVVYADLDGHLDLVDDPAAGAVLLESGILRPTGGPGLGFDPPGR